MTRLRTEHIRLNRYAHVLQHYQYYKLQALCNGTHVQYFHCRDDCCDSNNSGRCEYDGGIETVEHFIMACGRFEQARADMCTVIEPILYFYKHDYNLKNILFPPRDLRWSHRKMVLDSLCMH